MEPMRSPKLAPYLVVQNAAGLAKFIEEGIGGQAGLREQAETGKLNHLEMKVEDAVVMLSDVPDGASPFPAMLHLYVPDADVAYRRALRAGATRVQEPTDRSDGRRGGVRDAWGNQWWFTGAPGGPAPGRLPRR
jgi:PhnB protein